MIKHIFTTLIIAVFALTIFPSQIQAEVVSPLTVQPTMMTTTRAELFKQFKWSQDCQDRYSMHYKMGHSTENEGLKFVEVTPTFYILQIQCDHIEGAAKLIGVYEFMYVKKYTTTTRDEANSPKIPNDYYIVENADSEEPIYKINPKYAKLNIKPVYKTESFLKSGQLITFNSKKFVSKKYNLETKKYDYNYEYFSRTQIKGNPELQASPLIAIKNYEPFNYMYPPKMLVNGVNTDTDYYSCGINEEFRIGKNNRSVMSAVYYTYDDSCNTDEVKPMTDANY